MKTKIIASMVSLLALSLISGMIDLLTYRKNPKNYTKSLNKFTIRTSAVMCIYGIMGVGMAAFLFVGYFLIANGFEDKISGIAMMSTIIIVLFVMGVVCLLYPMPRFWDIVVDGDDITVIKLWLFKKSFKISEIEKCIMQTGDVRVYCKGKKRAAFMFDAMMNGVNNFLKRMDKEGILVEDNRPKANAEKEDYLDKDEIEKITDKNYFISIGATLLGPIYSLLIKQRISDLLISSITPFIAWLCLE